MKENKISIEELNNLIKTLENNKVFKLELNNNYKVLKFNQNALKDLQKFGYTELKKTYISSKKYSEKVVDILVATLKELGYCSK